jgi:hypothetical protein
VASSVTLISVSPLLRCAATPMPVLPAPVLVPDQGRCAWR